MNVGWGCLFSSGSCGANAHCDLERGPPEKRRLRSALAVLEIYHPDPPACAQQGGRSPFPERTGRGRASSSVCTSTLALVTGQEPVGTRLPGAAQQCKSAHRRRLHLPSRGRADGQLPPLCEDEVTGSEAGKPSVNERLKDVLNKPRERLEIEQERDQEKDRETENEREIDREIDRDPGLSH